ncbi:hypothetical protein L596_022469 [Steinernema carpocapsae]|uniref:Peptidase S1 domain-containing protein n=1 Tax=Steinernema carpocapsae TaxID=34508 RepID=A0A4U5MLR3_STECR|nr:hypothetical protein L596_022469 [Steinernema carpocapsae]
MGKRCVALLPDLFEHHDVLQEVDLKYEECKKRRDLPKDVICTEEKDKNVCAGDSGGGLMITPISRRHTVIGTVSEGTRCDFMVLKKFEKQPNSGGWFTDVRKYDVFLCEVAGICPIGKRKNKRGLRFGKKQVYDYVVA